MPSATSAPAVQQRQQRIGDYAVGPTVGKGSFGKVKRGTHIPTGEPVAIKILNRRMLASSNMDTKIRREIRILKLFQHANICRLFDVIYTDTDIFVVMEFVEGIELYDHIVSVGRLEENAARFVFQQLVCAVEYCHHFRVVHRDLKPENVLIGSNLSVKLIDFGLANLMQDGVFLRTSCGSPNYAAPEVITGRLYAGPEIDVWSSGVVLFALLCGCLPFDEQTVPQLFQKIRKGVYTIPPHVSPDARDLISRLLTVDPLQRLTIPQVRDHPWFASRLPRDLQYHPALFEPAAEEAVNDLVVGDVAKVTRSTARQVREALALQAAQRRRATAAASGAPQYIDPNKSPDSGAVPATTGGGHGSGIPAEDHALCVAYSILADKRRKRDLVALREGHDVEVASSSHASAATAAGQPTTATQRELHHGLVLSTSPAVAALLDKDDAAHNKAAYNCACSTLAPAPLPGSDVRAPAGGASFQLSSSWQQKGLADRISSSMPVGAQAAAAAAAASAAGTSYGGRVPTNEGASGTGSVRVGSVMKPTAVYDEAETNMAMVLNTGWRVGIMTDVPSRVAMGEIYAVLKELGLEWQVKAPFTLRVRSKAQPRSMALLLALMRLQDRHERGYVVDVEIVRGSPMAAFEAAHSITGRLRQRIG